MPLPPRGLSRRKSPQPFSGPPLQKRPPMCTQKGKPFFFFSSSFLFFLLFLLSPTLFLRNGRCVTFPPPDGNSCNDLLSFSSRSTCHICQPELFVVALGQRKKNIHSESQMLVLIQACTLFFFFSPPFILADNFKRELPLCRWKPWCVTEG